MLWNADCTIATVVDATLAVVSISLGFVFAMGLRRIWRPWYDQLIKPRANPPDWVHMVMWVIVYLCSAAAGITARLYYEQPANTTPFSLSVASQVTYYSTWGLNFVWFGVFYVAHALVPGLIVIILMVLLSIATMVMFFIIHWVPGLLMTFYVFWISFVLFLAIRLVMKNNRYGKLPERSFGDGEFIASDASSPSQKTSSTAQQRQRQPKSGEKVVI